MARCDKDFGDQIVPVLPKLKRYAIHLCGDLTLAEDLVQETVERALTHQALFQEGTNIEAWMFTILRNWFRTWRRKEKRMLPRDPVEFNSILGPDDQSIHIELKQTLEHLQRRVPSDQREALMLRAMTDFTYVEIADITKTCHGTVKSRINRARTRLEALA